MNKLGNWFFIVKLVAFGFLGAYLGFIDIFFYTPKFWFIMLPAFIINICAYFEGREDENDC